MNFTEILAEMVARGAENNSTRNGRWANLAYRRIANAHDWPFTFVAATGGAAAGNVDVADVRKVEFVGDVSDGTFPGRRLRKITVTEMAEDLWVEDSNETGTPEYWYLDGVGATAQIVAFPAGGTIHARYFKRLAPLTGTDEPAFDEEYHNLIVDRAMVEVRRDADEYEAADKLLQQFYVDLAAMAQDYQVFSREHSYIQHTNPYDG